MEDKFQNILNKVIKKSGRSRLEPYGELIEELRDRGLTYRDLSEILRAKLQLHVTKSTVNGFCARATPKGGGMPPDMSRAV